MIRVQHLLLFYLLILNQNLNAETATPVFSHKSFADVVAQHVNEGLVDYPSISRDKNYHLYLSALEPDTPLPSPSAALAYWINAYNALAIKGILDGRSPESFFGKIGYFYNAEYKVNGRTINLYDLEHGIIIPLGEPRIHFALNCASVSCPALSNKPYLADTLEQQLENAAATFINDNSRNRFDYDTKTAYLSEIFDWFEQDFAKHSGSVQNFLALYVTDNRISNALANNEFTIEYLEYDWSLNGTPPVSQASED